MAERGVLLYASAELAATKDPAKAYETIILEWDAKEQRYIGQSEGIDARDMAKSQFAVAYMKMIDGSYIFGTKQGEEQVIEYSPLIYCTQYKDHAQVGTLCRAMMHYGAAAQVVQYGMTTGLMNEGLEDVPFNAAVLGESVLSANTAVSNGLRLRSVTMDLKGAISYVVKYSVEDSAIDGKKLYAEYTLLGKTESVELVAGDDGRLWAVVNGVPAKDLGATLKIKAYWVDENGERMYSGELVYSGYEYIRSALNTASYSDSVKDLARAMAMYIHYADAYGN